jgi:hypothetical protein
MVRDRPDATVDELCWGYNRLVKGVQQTTPASFGRAMRRAGFVFKKEAAAERIGPAGRHGEAGQGSLSRIPTA